MPPQAGPSPRLGTDSFSLPATGWLALLALMCLALAGLLYALGAIPLLDVDEPRYAEAARQMLVTGDWITPVFNGALRFDKPPLFYWLIAGCYQVLGVTEQAARLPSALAAVGIGLGLVGFSRVALGRFLPGVLAATVWATSLLPMGLARMSITDMTLCACLTGTLMSLYAAAYQHPRWWLLAGLFAGLGLLAKGPVGVVLPGLILLTDTLWTRRWRPVFATTYFPAAGLLALALAAPWYGANLQRHGQLFLDALFLHNITRYQDVVSGHAQPWWFYSVVALVGLLPWTAYLPLALRQCLAPGQHRAAGGKTPPLWRYLALWAGGTFLFFQVANTKLLTYILPMFPAMALLLALAWETLLHTKADARAFGLARWGALGTLLVLGGATLLASWDFNRLLPSIVGPVSSLQAALWSVLIPMLVGTAGAAWLLWRRPRPLLALAAQAGGMAASGLLIVALLLPRIAEATQSELLGILRQVGPRAALVGFDLVRPSLTFYHRQPVPYLHPTDTAILRRRVLASQPQGLYVLAKRKQEARLLAALEEAATAPDGGSRLRPRALRRGPRFVLYHVQARP
jgi:4-amino-4-deoxy-L-arabinose transferase-like glycosyltransferase